MIISRAEKVRRDCENVGTKTSVLGANSYLSAGRVLITGGRPFLIYFVADDETSMESGTVFKLDVSGTHLLIAEKAPKVWRDEAFEYKMTGFKTNAVVDVLQFSETREDYTYQVTYGWSVSASGVRAYRTDLGGEQIFLGSGLPIALDSEEFLLPASSGAVVDDRLQLATWTSGAGTVEIDGTSMTGTGTSFESDLYEGGAVEVTDGDGSVSFVFVQTVTSDLSVVLSQAGPAMSGATYRYLSYTDERYRVSNVKDNKFAGVLVCSVQEDTR